MGVRIQIIDGFRANIILGRLTNKFQNRYHHRHRRLEMSCLGRYFRGPYLSNLGIYPILKRSEILCLSTWKHRSLDTAIFPVRSQFVVSSGVSR